MGCLGVQESGLEGQGAYDFMLQAEEVKLTSLGFRGLRV